MFGQQASAESQALFNFSLEELLEVRVKSTSFFDESLVSTSYSVTPTHAQDWINIGARNVGDVLNNMPSTIAPVGFGQSRVAAIRGYFSFQSPRGTAVRFDGVPMNKLRESGGLMAIDGFDLNTLSSVELIRGPGSSLHGNHAFHGVLSLESLSMDDNAAQVRVEAGSLEDNAVAARGHYQFGQHALTAAAAQREIGDVNQQYTYFDDDSNQTLGSSRSNARENANVLLKYQGALSPKFDVHATAFYLNFDAEQLPGIGYSPEFGSQKETDWTEFEDETLLFKVGFDYELNSDSDVGVVAYRWRYDDQFLGDYRNVPTLGRVNASYRSETHSGIKVHQRRTLSKHSHVSFGYEYQSQKLDDYYSLFTQAGVDVFPNRVDYEQVGFERTLHSAVVDGKQSLGREDLILIYGLRIDHYSDSDIKTQTSPRVGVTYWVNSKNALHLTYSEAFRAPGLIEMFGGFQIIENENLQPETLSSLEAKWSLQQTHWFHRATVFANNWDEGIQIELSNSVPSIAQYQNTGENRAYGVELESQGRWHNYQLNVATSFIRSENVEKNEHFSAFPHWNVLVDLGYEKDAWGYYWNNHFMRRSAASSGDLTDVGENYFRSDIVVKWQLANTLQLSAALKNIFDRDNSLPSYTAASEGLQDEHRNLLATLQYQF